MRRPRVRFTVRPLIMLALVAPAMAAILAAALDRKPARADEPEGRSLLQTLSEWKYPGSNMLGGASMGDGGNPEVQSVKCRANLTTPDPIEKVIAFYAEKLGPARRRPGAGDEVKDGGARSVSIQDDSQRRPITLRVFAVNTADTSTTLVISRADNEKETHIAWLHYIRLDGKRARPAP